MLSFSLTNRWAFLLAFVFLFFAGISSSMTLPDDPVQVLDTIAEHFHFDEFEVAQQAAEDFLLRDDLTDKQRRAALVLHARSCFSLSHVDLARESFCKVLRLDPQWRPDEIGFSKDEILVFEESREVCDLEIHNEIVELAGEQETGALPSSNSKTAKSAVLRSLIPGMGQYYKGQKTKGIIFQAAFVGAAAVALMSNSAMNSAADDYNVAYEKYQAAYSQEEMDAAFGAMQASYNEMDNKESTRDIAWMAAGGIWVVNLVDAYLGFPLEDAGVEMSTMVMPDGQSAIALQLWR